MTINFKKVLASTVIGLSLAPMPAMAIGIGTGTGVGVGADINANVETQTNNDRDTSSARVSSDVGAQVNTGASLSTQAGKQVTCEADDKNCDVNASRKTTTKDLSGVRASSSNKLNIRAAKDNTIN